MKKEKTLVERKMIDRIKSKIASSGKGIANFIRVKPDSKIKIRFISPFESAVLIKQHDKWGTLTPTPCLQYHFNKECEFCSIEEVRTKEVFAWTVYDYKAKKKKIFKWPATSMSPVNQLVTAYETYGNIIDRDYVLSRRGSKLDTSYAIMPLDKKAFTKKIKAYTKKQILELCIELSSEIEMEDLEDLEDLEGEIEYSEDENVDEFVGEFNEDEEDEEVDWEDEDEEEAEDEEEEERPRKRRQRK